jgi:ubiquinone biosynthesis protein COQ9
VHTLSKLHVRAWTAKTRCFSVLAGADTASDHSEAAIRKEILEKALSHINEHGFTLATIIAGAKDAGYGSFVHGMFPRGEAELIDHIMDKNREALHPKVQADPQWPQLPREEKLYRCFEHYFNMMVPYIHRWSQAMAVGMDPANLPYTTQKMFALADEVCHLSGIKSASTHWYQDRAAVAAVYVSTELFMLTDYTEDLKETKEFLQRRIDNFESFQKLAVEVSGRFCGGCLFGGFAHDAFLVVGARTLRNYSP